MLRGFGEHTYGSEGEDGMKTGLKVLILIGVIILVIIALFVGARIWLNYVWFNLLGYLGIFTKILWTKVWLWFVFFGLFGVFSYVNLAAVFRGGGIQSVKFQQQGQQVEISGKVTAIVAGVVLFLIALIMAGNGSGKWEAVLKLFSRSGFGVADPLFGRDAGFYVFVLPVYDFLKSWSLGAVIVMLIVVSFIYLLSGHIRSEGNTVSMSPRSRRHILLMFVFIAVIIGWNYWLKRYRLLLSPGGLVYGAVYKDAKVQRPAYLVMIGVSLFTAVMTWVGMRKLSFKQPLIGYGVLIGAAIVVTGIVPGVVQQFSVRPNELQKETPYIRHNIEFTRKGFNFEGMEAKAFPVSDSLTGGDFAPGAGVTKHIRVWDHRPLEATYQQLQEFRLYYDFKNVDVDRYHFPGDLRQVMLSGREIKYSEIPPQAQTWVNRTLQYTHGYGLAMSPVNEIGSEGLPTFFIKDIPPKISVPLTLDRPQIYFGEETDPYVIVNTKLPEFDYPKGNTNVTTNYAGSGGIPIKNGLRKLLLAIRLRNLEIVFTDYLKADSRLMIYRNITERVPKLVPFLRYDPDPYLVVDGGGLHWIIDAYTTSASFPYSTPYQGQFNYIRNAVKVTVDAYTGDVVYYIMDREDPLLKTYGKMFPGTFRDISEMPAGLLAHIRYPIYLFSVQAVQYQTYHMTDPVVFYNKEDLWSIPKEIYSSTETEVIPYYVFVKIPELGGGEQYALILPFTPSNKNNMVAWIAAMCDPDHYGKFIEYQFPKEKLIYGPMQIESRIDQNTEISQLFTLWSQLGSKIIRGNMLVIPIKDSLIYVEPVFLVATNSELPELKRVIVGYMDKISFAPTLGEALAGIFGAIPGVAAPAVSPQAEIAAGAPLSTALQSIGQLVQELLSTYQDAYSSLKKEDLANYGKLMQELGPLLEDLKSKTEGAAPLPGTSTTQGK
jgi:uncharacterized membrane protein (UPF0182 family)